jgi:hypothetical protein
LNFSCQLIHQKIYEVLKIISFLKIWIVIEKIVWHHCATLLSYLRLVYFCWLIRYFSPKKRNSDHFLAKSNWNRFLLEHWIDVNRRIKNIYQARRKRGGRGGHVPPPPLFVRSVNPISTRGGTLSPPSTMCPPPRFSDLATALYIELFRLNKWTLAIKRLNSSSANRVGYEYRANSETQF